MDDEWDIDFPVPIHLRCCLFPVETTRLVAGDDLPVSNNICLKLLRVNAAIQYNAYLGFRTLVLRYGMESKDDVKRFRRVLLRQGYGVTVSIERHDPDEHCQVIHLCITW
jgi:hypothetical protein